MMTNWLHPSEPVVLLDNFLSSALGHTFNLVHPEKSAAGKTFWGDRSTGACPPPRTPDAVLLADPVDFTDGVHRAANICMAMRAANKKEAPKFKEDAPADKKASKKPKQAPKQSKGKLYMGAENALVVSESDGDAIPVQPRGRRSRRRRSRTTRRRSRRPVREGTVRPANLTQLPTPNPNRYMY